MKYGIIFTILLKTRNILKIVRLGNETKIMKRQYIQKNKLYNNG